MNLQRLITFGCWILSGFCFAKGKINFCANALAVKKTLSMKFVYGQNGAMNKDARITADSTFEAIIRGERSATSREDNSLADIVPADIVRFVRDTGGLSGEIIVRVLKKRDVKKLSPSYWALPEGYDLQQSQENWHKGLELNELQEQIVFEVLQYRRHPADSWKEPEQRSREWIAPYSATDLPRVQRLVSNMQERFKAWARDPLQVSIHLTEDHTHDGRLILSPTQARLELDSTRSRSMYLGYTAITMREFARLMIHRRMEADLESYRKCNDPIASSGVQHAGPEIERCERVREIAAIYQEAFCDFFALRSTGSAEAFPRSATQVLANFELPVAADPLQDRNVRDRLNSFKSEYLAWSEAGLAGKTIEEELENLYQILLSAMKDKVTKVELLQDSASLASADSTNRELDLAPAGLNQESSAIGKRHLGLALHVTLQMPRKEQLELRLE